MELKPKGLKWNKIELDYQNKIYEQVKGAVYVFGPPKNKLVI